MLCYDILKHGQIQLAAHHCEAEIFKQMKNVKFTVLYVIDWHQGRVRLEKLNLKQQKIRNKYCIHSVAAGSLFIECASLSSICSMVAGCLLITDSDWFWYMDHQGRK